MSVEVTEQEAPAAEPQEQVHVESTQSSPPVYEAPEPTADDPTEDTPAAEAPVDEWDDDLIKTADRYGFTADEAKAYGSRDTFERALAALDRQAAKFGREQLKAMEQPNEAPTERDEFGRFKPKAAEAPPAEKPLSAEEYKKLELGLNPEEWDPDTIKTITSLNDHYDTLFRKQQDQIRQQEELLLAIGQTVVTNTGASQAEDSQKLTTEMDTFFNSLGTEFEPIFGKGPRGTLQDGQPTLNARVKLVEEMRVLDIADAQANRPRQSYSELAQRALRSLHFDTFQTTARKQVSNKLQERQSQQIARPTGRNGKAPAKIDTAVKRVEEFYRSKGFNVSDFGDDDPEV